MTKAGVSVVLPTYNERENIRELVPELHRLLGERPHEILIVDDESTDGTVEVAQTLADRIAGLILIRKPRREGIGAALRVGYDRARNDILISSDSDLSFDPKDVLRLIDAIESGFDLVLGCRHSGGGAYETPSFEIRIKFVVSRIGNYVVRRLTGLPLHDYSANFRAIRRDVWRTIQTRDKTNSLLLEMILEAAHQGYRITEIPVTFRDRRYGRSKLNLAVEVSKFVIRLFGYVVKYRIWKRSRASIG